MLVVVAAWLVALFMTGMWLGRWFGQRNERGVVAESPAASQGSVALPTLRCENGDPPRVWTRVEAEARMHTAQMSLRSAESAGVWTDLGRRWAQLAEAQLAEVGLCWGGEKP